MCVTPFALSNFVAFAIFVLVGVGVMLCGMFCQVSPTDVEEGMRVGVDRTKYSVQIPLPPKIDPTVRQSHALFACLPSCIFRVLFRLQFGAEVCLAIYDTVLWVVEIANAAVVASAGRCRGAEIDTHTYCTVRTVFFSMGGKSAFFGSKHWVHAFC